ncbi:MAG: hypothetical protein HKN35_10050 [Woeseia sp.]|nr:hypothetical protein [Woeseia sp.]NNE61227.1 hypothetical protein [Woeseia sp.]
MKWATRKAHVEQLATRAHERAEQLAKHRAALTNWRYKAFGTPEALTWSFAAGALWSVTRDSGDDERRTTRMLAKIANYSWIAWPYLSKLSATAQTPDLSPDAPDDVGLF